MTATIPTAEPQEIIAGDTLQWTRSLTDYPPADSWVLSYALVNERTRIDLTASDNGDGTHLVSVAASVTADYLPGSYQWQAFATKAAERFTVGHGALRVVANYAAGESVDTRTHARRMLDALEVRLQMRAPDDILSYSEEATTVTRMAPEQALEQYKFWRRRVREEDAIAAVRAGKPNPAKIPMTMSTRNGC